MSNDPESIHIDYLVGEKAAADHFDMIQEYEEYYDGILERISELSHVTARVPEAASEEADSWKEQQNLRLDILEDCAQKLESLNKQYRSGGLGKGKAYAPKYEDLIEDIRKHLKRSPHVSFSTALTECAENKEGISVSSAQKHIRKSDVMTPELERLIREKKSR